MQRYLVWLAEGDRMGKLNLIESLLRMAGRERVYEGGLQERQGLYYKPNKRKGFTGVNRAYFENDQMKFETTFKDGKQEGLARWWHENGQMSSESTFKDGKQEGLRREWYENGDLEDERCYSNGEEVDMSNCQ